jgi:hypothetical protein
MNHLFLSRSSAQLPGARAIQPFPPNGVGDSSDSPEVIGINRVSDLTRKRRISPSVPRLVFPSLHYLWPPGSLNCVLLHLAPAPASHEFYTALYP